MSDTRDTVIYLVRKKRIFSESFVLVSLVLMCLIINRTNEFYKNEIYVMSPMVA